MAVDPIGHAPEVVEFEVVDLEEADPSKSEYVREILRSAVKNLALLQNASSKLSNTPGDMRDVDYRVHPIFSPYFVFSHRKKRKVELHVEDIYGLVQEAPKSTLARILSRSNRDYDDELPKQLDLFSAYFNREDS